MSWNSEHIYHVLQIVWSTQFDSEEAETFESVTFTTPTNSLTIKLSGDLGIPILSKDILTVKDADVAVPIATRRCGNRG